ncbi:MAG: FKBP-type peptidyl-prolyl cis-trans isomerase [Pseudomonadota bacterium]
MNEPLRVGPDTRVTLHFTLRLPDGEIVDSTVDRAPAVFVFGDGNLLPGFEQALRGLKAGDRRAVVIEPQDGFGDYSPANVQTMARSQFAPDLRLVRGLMLSFADKQGELPGVIIGFDDDSVQVDFNHPLAGRQLGFEVEILAVESCAAEQQVAIRDLTPGRGASRGGDA